MLIVAALGTGFALAQQPGSSRDDRILPDRLGLPATNTRSSEPFVTRIYRADDNNKPLKKQPQGYPFTITEEYERGENEIPIVHKAVDITSRPAPNEPARPMDFKAGVYGLVVRAGGGDWGTIAVQLRDGSVIQYLHTTASHVKVGDVVAPDTLLGVTGRTGARDIHLHIQARDKFNQFISPDLAFKVGQKKTAEGGLMRITNGKGKVLVERQGDLAGSDLSGLDLSGAWLEGQSLVYSNLSRSILTSAVLDDADLSNACLSDAVLEGVLCMGARFDNAVLRSADLYWALASKASFCGADLTGADLRGAALQDADFTGAKLERANFGRDNLNGSTSVQGAHFTGTNLKGAFLEGALYNARTRFPDGFNPESSGMIYQEDND